MTLPCIDGLKISTYFIEKSKTSQKNENSLGITKNMQKTKIFEKIHFLKENVGKDCSILA